jgi:hypothetical protein
MALSILDGNQSATTLSTIVSSGQHIPSHTVVSLGSQAISNITSAISGTSVCVGNLGLLQSTVGTEGITANTNFIKIGGHTGTSTTGNIAHVSAVGAIRVDGSNYTQPVSLASVPTHGVTLASTTVTISSLPAISGTVTANVFGLDSINSINAKIPVIAYDESIANAAVSYVVPVQISNNDGTIGSANPLPVSGTVTIGSALPAGTNRIGVVTIGAGTVTIGAGTAQIGSVTVGNATTSSAVFVKICGERNGATTNEAREIQTDDDGFLYAVLADPSSPSSKAVIYDPVAGNSYVNVRQTASVTIGSALPAGTNQIGSVTASGTVTANIGGIANSVTLPVRLFAEKFGEAPSGQDTLVVCNSSGMLLVDANSGGSSVLGFDGNAFVQVKPVSGSSVTIGNSVTISSLPPISGTVTANTFALQGTAVTTSNFTSITPSTVLASFNATREVLTIFNEGAGNLHVCVGATCTTIAYQVRLSAGDYYEVPNHQTTITHSAVFATAGTARVTQVS